MNKYLPESTNCDTTKISDQDLYNLCKKYGTESLTWRRKFIGLLPEVTKRKLYAKKGFTSIFEFAARLAGINQKQVAMVLNINNKFEDKPLLQKLLVSGEVSANKLERVAFVATKETEDFWANQAQLLPKSALATLVRDFRVEHTEHEQEISEGLFANNPKNKNEIGLSEAKIETESTAGRKLQYESEITKSPNININDLLNLGLDQETISKLKSLKIKGFNLNKLISELLEKREAEIVDEKEKIAIQCHSREGGNLANQSAKILKQDCHVAKPPRNDKTNQQHNNKPSRYIPIKTRKLLTQQFGKKCSIPNCTKPAKQIHHTTRFNLTKSHNPNYLAPICKNHHKIAHSIDVKVQEIKFKKFLQ